MYGEEVSEGMVIYFLQRRRAIATATLLATSLQVLGTYLHFTRAAAGLSLLLAPLSLVERQWCTLVTKSHPRSDRSEISHVVGGLQRAAGGALSLPRYSLGGGYFRVLLGLEAVVGVLQVLAGAVSCPIPSHPTSYITTAAPRN
mmetsp:Transcript_14163/g.45187  ORF Transcript_14163/g.45187 Transcript_14163/m.45187 type:complete len:144 (+) Transcript_14163:636-1067(+)